MFRPVHSLEGATDSTLLKIQSKVPATTKLELIFTARIRRMTEGYIFTLSTLARSRQGGTPSQVWMVVGGYPISGLGGGVPHLRSGGVPHHRYGGYPSQVLMVGVPGVPPQLGLDGGGYPGYPPTIKT